MPTQQDISPFLKDYYSGNVGNSGGWNTGSGGSTIGNLTGMVDPVGGMLMGGDLFGGLFGGGQDRQWQPYINEQGQYVWTDPNKRNPVPVANVPGAQLNPSNVYRKASNNVQSIYDLMPYLNQISNSNITPNALAQLQASQATSGGYAQLMTDLYNQYGPQLNAIGNEIQRRNALSQAGTDLEVMQGPGKDLVKGAYDLSQIYDKPYYDTRQTTADNIAKLFSSIDLNGGISDTERSEIGKGLAIQNQQAGTAFTPSQTNTVSNAIQYGKAGHERQNEAKGQLSAAIAASSAFLPTSKSGVDVFQVATGKPSMPNPGNSLFTGVNTNTGQGGSLAGQLSGLMYGNNNQTQNQQALIDSQKKDWLDKMNQITSSIKDIGSMASGFAGMCWIAREVYGVDNPAWLAFRYWITNDAPKWMLSIYKRFGARIASYISDKPTIKRVIRLWMNSKINL